MVICTTYNINMRTPIGDRKGQIYVCQDSGKLSGKLNILEHSEPFEGTIDDVGNCKITGEMITLMRRVSYEATGRITPDGLMLSLPDEQNMLVITGEPYYA